MYAVLSMHIISYPYHIRGTPLFRVCSLKDLWVVLDPKHRFHKHVEAIMKKALSVLGCVKRWAKKFNVLYSTKLLYTSLVRPISESASVV